MLATKSNDLDEDEAFLRRLILPEEDRRLFTSAPWRGGYRWFRSHNVIPIEQMARTRHAAETSRMPRL